MLQNKKNLLLLLSTILVLSFLGALIYLASYTINYRENLTPVTFRYNQTEGAVVHLYKGAKKDLVEPDTQGEPVSIEDGSTHTLEDWPYVAVVHGSEVQESKQIIYPQQTPLVIHLSVNKSERQLTTLAELNRDEIEDTITTQYPNVQTIYDIQDATLHGDGTWATVTLHYKGSDKMSRDTLHVVLRQTDKWQVVAGPSISIHQTPNLRDAPRSLFWSILPEEVTAS